MNGQEDISKIDFIKTLHNYKKIIFSSVAYIYTISIVFFSIYLQISKNPLYYKITRRILQFKWFQEECSLFVLKLILFIGYWPASLEK